MVSLYNYFFPIFDIPLLAINTKPTPDPIFEIDNYVLILKLIHKSVENSISLTLYFILQTLESRDIIKDVIFRKFQVKNRLKKKKNQDIRFMDIFNKGL